MEQSELWCETIFDAIGAAVLAAGRPKDVGRQLWPTLDETTAVQRLRDAKNPGRAQKLCPSELVLLARLAAARGDHSIMEFLARDLGYELKPLAPAEAKKRARRARITALLDEVARLTKDDE